MVKNESFNVISNLEILSFSILSYIKKYVFSNMIPDDEIPRYINIIKKDFLKEYSDEKFPFGFRKNKFYNIVNKNFNIYMDLFIKNGAYISAISIFENKSDELSKSFKIYSDKLTNLLNHVQVCSFDKDFEDTYFLDILESEGIHTPDDEILLDSFKCTKSLEEIVSFITMDADILDCRRSISELFDYKVYLKKARIPRLLKSRMNRRV